VAAPAALGEVLKPVVVRQLGPRWEEVAYQRVSRVLRRVVRASSAMEGDNRVVRTYQARHSNLSE
jgi:hypothetical protein